MKFKRALLAAFVMFTVFLLSACTGNKEIVKETEMAMDIGGPTEIHYQVFFRESSKTELYFKPYLDAVANFNQLHPDIKVIIDYMELPAGMTVFDPWEEMMKMLESGKAADVLPWSPGSAQIAKEKGWLRDLLPLQSGDLDIPQQVLDSGMIDGELLVLPIGAYPWGMYYNKTLFDEAKIPYPEGDWTWDQFRDISKKMKDHGSLLSYDFFYVDLLLASTGNGVLSPDGTTCVGYLDSSEAIRVIQWLNASYRDENRTTPIEVIDMMGKFDLSQRAMVLSSVGASFSNFQGENIKKLGVAPVPYFEGGKRVNPIGFSGYGISRKSEHPEEAWQFLHYLTLEKNDSSIQFSNFYIPTSKAILEAPAVKDDPIKSVFYEELNHAGHLSSEKNEFFWQASNGALLGELQKLLTAGDDEIPNKLHELALKVDAEMNRLKLGSEKLKGSAAQ